MVVETDSGVRCSKSIIYKVSSYQNKLCNISEYTCTLYHMLQIFEGGWLGGVCSKFSGGGWLGGVCSKFLGRGCLLKNFGGGCLLQILGGGVCSKFGGGPPIFGIRSTFGRYASYWNAFLFVAIFNIETTLSVAPELQGFVNSLENCQNFSKTRTFFFDKGATSLSERNFRVFPKLVELVELVELGEFN